MKKKQYVQICSLKLEASSYKYSELAKLLNIKTDDVETWSIEAIASGIIDAKIDQLQEQIVIKSHKLKTLTKEEWVQIRSRVTEWRQKFEYM